MDDEIVRLGFDDGVKRYFVSQLVISGFGAFR